MRSLRTVLALSRPFSLPTVWSNCLAGWWLGGGGHYEQLPFLFAGATFLYLGGAFLNDAFDAEFDRQHRRSRPIPAGAISLGAVRLWGVAWLVLGEASLFWLGTTTFAMGLALALCVLLFNAFHRLFTFSSALLGACRFLLYLTAASMGLYGVSGWSIWCGLALAMYVTGLELIAAQEEARRPLVYWPALLLGAPIALALLMNAGQFRESGLLLSAVLGLWVVRCLRYTLWSKPREFARTTSGLVAGIVFVDWLAAVNVPRPLGFAFIGLFGVMVLFQRVASVK